jgi:hypothetical protein
MAATATQQIIANGPRNLVLKYTIAGTTSDATAVKLVDVSALDSSIGVNDLKLMSIQAALTGFTCSLLWDATANVDLVYIPDEETVNLDFSKFGGIPNNAGSGATGDVLFTTVGYTASGDGGIIYLHFKKS